MRILVVTTWYPPHHWGGYELLCWDVVQRARAAGHEVHVLCSHHRNADTPDGDEPGIRRVLDPYVQNELMDVPTVPGRLRRERHNQAAFRAALSEVRPDLVSVWQMGALSSGLMTTLKRTGLPVVFGICDNWPIYFTKIDRWSAIFEKTALRRFVGRVAKVVLRTPVGPPRDLGEMGPWLFMSEATRDHCEELSAFDYPTSAVVFGGVDQTTFPPTPRERPPYGGRLLYVGRFDPRKGIYTALEAMTRLPDATLRLVGRGGAAERERILERARELGVSERIELSSADRDELPAVYRAADILLFPSEWPEPFGIVPLEGMACATPVVATGVGGSGEYLADGENCVLYTPGDADELAAAVQRVATDPALADRIVAGGLRTATELDVRRFADDFLAWFEAAVDPDRPRPAQRVLPAWPEPTGPTGGRTAG